MNTTCPACGEPDARVFHEADRVPVNSCLLLDDEAEARSFPTGSLAIAHCAACGFIFNAAFDQGHAEYSQRYEETQACSPRFVEFATDLAREWVVDHDLEGGSALEIGCGKGEFLVWMVEAGLGSGIGIDPGVHPERHTGVAAEKIDWLVEKYDAGYGEITTDAVVCRHTLEHIGDVRGFMDDVRRGLGDRDAAVLFELPDTQRVLEEAAFWDVYYEHCSYFTAGSLSRLFARTGFDVGGVELAYEEQYLLLDARPGEGDDPTEDDRTAIADGVAHFEKHVGELVDTWRERLDRMSEAGQPVVLWGGGSKAVAFLTTVGVGDAVAGAVDINPVKQGKYIAGSGHRVLAPAELVELQPALVVAVNPVYRDEIRGSLDDLGLEGTELTTL